MGHKRPLQDDLETTALYSDWSEMTIQKVVQYITNFDFYESREDQGNKRSS